MIGIDIERLDTVIKKNDIFCDSINNNINSMIENINELNSLYLGNDLQFLFQNLTEQVTELGSIPKIVESYSEVMRNVKTGYLAQNVNLNYKLSRISSNTNNM